MRCTCGTLGVFTVLGVLSLAGMSCTSQRLGYDHRQMRTELLTAYEEQLMDNLIRAREGLPLLQVKYGVIDGSSKTNYEATGELSDNDTKVIVGSNSSNSETTDVDGSGGSASVKLESTMAIKGTPVLDDPGLYKAYRDFARTYLVKGPTLDDPDPLMHEMAIRTVGTRIERTYYWIPRTVETTMNGRTKTIQVRAKLDELLDRVMLDQKKASGASLSGSADLLVMSAQPLGFVSPGESVRGYLLTGAPGINKLVYGQLKLESKGERCIVGVCAPGCETSLPGGVSACRRGDDLQTIKESVSVTGLLVPESVDARATGSDGLTRLKLYLTVSDVKKLAAMRGVNCSESSGQGCDGGSCPLDKVVVDLAQSKLHTVSYKDSKNDAVDLNETVVALVKFLNKANEEDD